MFAIVCFLAENSVDFIPEEWLVGRELCFYPVSNVATAKKRHELPTEKWKQYHIRIISMAVSFDEAIKKVALAEDTSCISDSDIPTLAKRVRPSDSVYVQSKLFSSDEERREDNEIDMKNCPSLALSSSLKLDQVRQLSKEPQRMNISADEEVNENNAIVKNKFPPLPISVTSTPNRGRLIQQNSQIRNNSFDDGSKNNNTVVKKKIHPLPLSVTSTPNRGRLMQYSQMKNNLFDEESGENETIEKTNCLSSHDQVRSRILQERNVSYDKSREIGCSSQSLIHQQGEIMPSQVTLGDVYQKMCTLEARMNHLQKNFKKFIAKTERLLIGGQSTGFVPISHEEIAISSVEEYDIVVGKIEDREYAAALTGKLASIGGKTIDECVTRIMSALMMKSVMTGFNRTGRKGKKSFERMEGIIFDAVRVVHKNATKKDVEVCISKQFHRATDSKLKEVKKSKFKNLLLSSDSDGENL